MDYQVIVVGFIVAAAAIYAAKKAWNLLRPTKGSSGCGCSTATRGCGSCPLTEGKAP